LPPACPGPITTALQEIGDQASAEVLLQQFIDDLADKREDLDCFVQAGRGWAFAGCDGLPEVR
jgi:hypothetical protein